MSVTKCRRIGALYCKSRVEKTNQNINSIY